MRAPRNASAGRSGNAAAESDSIENAEASGYGAAVFGTPDRQLSNQGRCSVTVRIIGAVQRAGVTEPARGLFGRGMRLVASYIRLHPKPFLASVGGALVFAVASIALTTALGRASDEVLRPAFEGAVAPHRIWFA